MRNLVGLSSFLLALSGCATTTYTHGVPNWREVEPGLYRSGQPTTLDEWRWIASQGVRHVLKLNFEDEGSDDLATAAGLDVYYLPIQPEGDDFFALAFFRTFLPPERRDVEEADRLIARSRPGDAWLVHCTHGQDRTGLVVGRHRVMADGWSKERAYREMLADGFHKELFGLQTFWMGWHPGSGGIAAP